MPRSTPAKPRPRRGPSPRPRARATGASTPKRVRAATTPRSRARPSRAPSSGGRGATAPRPWVPSGYRRATAPVPLTEHEVFRSLPPRHPHHVDAAGRVHWPYVGAWTQRRVRELLGPHAFRLTLCLAFRLAEAGHGGWSAPLWAVVGDWRALRQSQGYDDSNETRRRAMMVDLNWGRVGFRPPASVLFEQQSISGGEWIDRGAGAGAELLLSVRPNHPSGFVDFLRDGLPVYVFLRWDDHPDGGIDACSDEDRGRFDEVDVRGSSSEDGSDSER